jgi:hypothetical protein
LHNEELHKFYSSPNIIRIMKPRRMNDEMSGVYTMLDADAKFVQNSAWKA